MKNLTLTSTLVALLTLPTFGQSASSTNSSITAKEQEIARLQKEISALRSKLNSPAPSLTATGDYVIKTGDTVSSIARKHQMTASQLIALNNLSDPSKIQIGQTLKVGRATSAPAPVKPTQKVATSSPASKTSDYLIQKGDTFYSIARKHKMTVTKLRALNPDIKTHLITTGSTLKVSGTPVTSPSVVATKTIEKKATEFRATSISGNSKPTMISTKKKATSTPAPAQEKIVAAPPVKKKTPPTPPTPEYSKKETVAAVAPPIPPKIDEPEPKKPSSVASIILTDEMTFDAFAKKHEVSTDQLNSLNGWSLPKATVLARGSEIYIPK